MKRLIVAALLAVALAAPGLAPADTCDYDESQSHPLRIAAYFLYPVGVATKWLVAWPIHYVVSRPSLETVFGHTEHDYAFDEEESF